MLRAGENEKGTFGLFVCRFPAAACRDVSCRDGCCTWCLRNSNNV